MKILHVVGTRPNFIKIASILRGCKETGEIESVLVHTGQHYSNDMNQTFFDELEIPKPDINLGVGSASHAQQTAEIMKRFEPVLKRVAPDAVLVVGDVNSTVACVLVAAKLGIKTIHVEAGLRSFDRTMPEEINRIVTDAISDILFVSEPSALTNLSREGVDTSKCHFVGNVMIDTLELHREKSQTSDVVERLKLRAKDYGVVTLHRPSNVDDRVVMGRIIGALAQIEKEIMLVFPVHPRTRNKLESNGLGKKIKSMTHMQMIDPLGYLDFLKLMSDSKLVITDSGGIQEETTVLGKPCLTVRENTERPVTITEGTNMLVGTDTNRIIEGYKKSVAAVKSYARPRFWDGKAAERISWLLLNSFNGGRLKSTNNT